MLCESREAVINLFNGYSSILSVIKLVNGYSSIVSEAK